MVECVPLFVCNFVIYGKTVTATVYETFRLGRQQLTDHEYSFCPDHLARNVKIVRSARDKVSTVSSDTSREAATSLTDGCNK